MSDYRQLAECLNNIGCLSYRNGNIELAEAQFTEALECQAIVAQNSLYAGSKYSSHAASINVSVTEGNLGFLGLSKKDYDASVTLFEFAVHVRSGGLTETICLFTLVSHSFALVFERNKSFFCGTPTLHSLHLWNISRLQIIFPGRKRRHFRYFSLRTFALFIGYFRFLHSGFCFPMKVFRRIIHMQVDAYGPDDPRSLATATKIKRIENEESGLVIPTGLVLSSTRAVSTSANQQPSTLLGKGARLFNVFKQRKK